MKIAILGFGVEGQAALSYWRTPGNQVTICDQRRDTVVPEGVDARLGPDYLTDLEQFDLLVRSPSLHPQTIVNSNSPAILKKVTSGTNEFLRVCPTTQVIGVTGTKGKGTTSTLIAQMLTRAGYRVHLGGNIGQAALSLLDAAIAPTDWVVLELSSFQLIDLQHSPGLAVCLMVVPEHLNWHADMNEYITAKSQLFSHQQPTDTAVYYADNPTSVQIAASSPGRKVPYAKTPGAIVQDNLILIDGQAICSVADLQLLGRHNWQNALAATTAVWQIIQDPAPIREVLTTFRGLEHRLELVREVDGVRYYNDSFAATPDAAIGALEAIEGPKVMIMGGFDRQLPIEHLARAISEHCRDLTAVILMGESAQRLAAALDQTGFQAYTISKATTLSAIVKQAQNSARPGDAVVLSPGFASFDMFKNFEERGQLFKEAVHAL